MLSQTAINRLLEVVIKSGPHSLTGILQLLLAEYNCFFLLHPDLCNWPQRTWNALMVQTICSMIVYWHVIIIPFASLFMLLLIFIKKKVMLRNRFSLSSALSCAQNKTGWWKREWNWPRGPKGWRTRWWVLGRTRGDVGRENCEFQRMKIYSNCQIII